MFPHSHFVRDVFRSDLFLNTTSVTDYMREDR